MDLVDAQSRMNSYKRKIFDYAVEGWVLLVPLQETCWSTSRSGSGSSDVKKNQPAGSAPSC